MAKQPANSMSAYAKKDNRPSCSLNTLTVQERRILLWSRAAYGKRRDCRLAAPDRYARVMAQLAAQIDRFSLTVFGVESQFASEDELAMLSWLSMLQRPSQSAELKLSNPLQQCLRDLAGLLLQDGRRLPARPMTSEAMLKRMDCLGIATHCDEAESADPSQPTSDDAAVVIALVKELRLATTSQFRALGISSQKLSRLCRKGYIERVSHGLYSTVDKRPSAVTS
jgi:hypothetical protein